MSSESVPIQFEILEQPNACFQFSNSSDISRRGRAKAIVGENATKCVPTWPTVRVKIQNEAIEENEAPWIMVELFQNPRDARLGRHLSPHQLATFNERSGVLEIFDSAKQMTSVGGGEYEFSLENYFIMRTANAGAEDALRKKLMLKEKRHTPLEEIRKSDNDIIAEVQQIPSDNNGEFVQLFLCFEVYMKEKAFLKERTLDFFTSLAGPYFSELITNEKFQCSKITPACSNIDGGTEVEICLSKVPGEELGHLDIVFYEIDQRSQITWQALSGGYQIVEHDEGTCTVTAKTPSYSGLTQAKQITCYVQVKRLRDKRATKGLAFVYKQLQPRNKRRFSNGRHVPYSPARDRITVRAEGNCSPSYPKREDGEQHLTVHVNRVLHIIADTTLSTEDKLSAIASYTADYASKNKRGNTFFHDALVDDSFNKLYKWRALHRLLTEAVNSQDETLLHHACNFNQPVLTRQLIGLGCPIDALDANGNSPLHIAIHQKSHHCIEVFQTILEQPDEYEERVRLGLKQLFHTYNDEGHTVLHAAVLNDLVELVAAMLEFCRTEDKAAPAIEVLGCGDSIMHLAATKGLKKIAQTILERFPDALEYENYAGDTILDISKYKMFAHDLL